MKTSATHTRTATLWFMTMLAVVLAACSTEEKKVDPILFPTDYKNQILVTMPQILIDPTNVHDAFITEPILNPDGAVKVYYVCVRSNSRGYNREYTGSKDRIAYFFGGRLSQLVDATPEQCGKAPYKPFPELEKLCLGSKCE
jgi:hypothetical protein